MNPTRNVNPSAQELNERFTYNPETGEIRNKINLDHRKRNKAGELSGCICSSHGYRIIRWGRRLMLAHRVAWAMIYGEWPILIDHINGDKADNRIANLRLATKSQNAFNSKGHKDGASGVKGVSWNKQARKWGARITINGKYKHIGLFQSIKAAAAAYSDAAHRFHGEFARTA